MLLPVFLPSQSATKAHRLTQYLLSDKSLISSLLKISCRPTIFDLTVPIIIFPHHYSDNLKKYFENSKPYGSNPE